MTNETTVWKTVAKWPYPEVGLGNEDNMSVDYHRTRAAADAVISRLLTEGFGGDGEIFPIEAYCIEVPRTEVEE